MFNPFADFLLQLMVDINYDEAKDAAKQSIDEEKCAVCDRKDTGIIYNVAKGYHSRSDAPLQN